MLIVEGLFSLSCFFKMLWGLLCESPKLRIKTSYNGLKTTVNLVVVEHENLAHLLFVVFTIEYSAARRHSLLSIFASKVSRHYDLFVVGTVCAWFLRATKLVKSASLWCASHHECCRKSPRVFVYLPICHSSGLLTIESFDKAEEVALKVFRVVLLKALEGVVGLLELISWDSILALDNIWVELFHLGVNLGKRAACGLSFPRLLIQSLWCFNDVSLSFNN